MLNNHTALVAAVMLVGVAVGSAAVAAEYALDSDEKKYSYAVGTKIAEQLLQQFNPENAAQAGIDFAALRAGLEAALSGGELQLSTEQIDQVLQRRQLAEQAAAAAAAAAAKTQGATYRAENKAKPEVTETASGLQYRVLQEGEGERSPTEADSVVVHYAGTLIDGTVFDSSYARGEPATFSLAGIVPGWQEVLQLMTVGDKWAVVLPPELAYGERGVEGLIGPNQTLLFDIELLEIK